MTASTLDQRYLAIYLRDHFAGSTAGIELARRTAGANRGSEFGPPLEELAREITEDRTALRRLMRRLGVAPDPIKPSLAWAAEKLGRLKLNGRLTGYSPLSRVLEIEGLIGGVSGKLSLWRTMHELGPGDPRLDAAELATLAERAEHQLGRLHELRARAGLAAFSGSPERQG
jgi:hypothetical protein